MAQSTYVYNYKTGSYGIPIYSDRMQTITLFNQLGCEFCITCEHIAKKYPEEDKIKRLYFYELALKHAEFVLKNGSLSDPTQFRKAADSYRTWINEIKGSVSEKARAEYWKNHPEEKAALDNERLALTNSLKQFEMEMDNIPGTSDKRYYESQIAGLKEQKKALGMFKTKERKEIQDQINESVANYNNLCASMKPTIDEIERKKADVLKRLAEVDSELNKDRF